MTRTLAIVAAALLCTTCSKRMEPRFELSNRQDNELHVGMVKVDIMPVPFSKDGTCPAGKFCYETYTNLGAAAGCPDNKDNHFEGVLTKPKGDGKCVEPFFDANGNGRFDGLWIGGYDIARAATGSDKQVSIYVKALALTRNDEHVVLFNLPFVGFPTLQLSFFRERIAALSGGTLAKERVIPMMVHGHNVPDTQGLWGPDMLKNYDLKLDAGTNLQGVLTVLANLFDTVQFPLPSMNYRNNAYWFWVEEQVLKAIKQAIDKREPVGIKVGIKETPHRETGCQTKPFEGKVELDCDGDGVVNEGSDLRDYSGGNAPSDCLKKGEQKPVRLLVEDLRAPFAMDYNVYTLQFVSKASKKAVGTFITWGFHVEEADAENTIITGDIAAYACDLVEQREGGVCMFQIGPEGGLTSSNSDAIPFVDAKGFFHDCSGKPYPGSDKTDDYLKYLDMGELKMERTNFQDAISAGRNVAKTSLRSLELNPTVYSVDSFKARHLHALLPMDNPFLYFMGRMEIMNGMSMLLRKGIDREKGRKIKDIVFRGELSKDNESCGGAVCIRALFSFIELDLRDDKKGKSRKIALATAPGELFPEYHIGRKKSSFRFQSIDSSPTLKGLGEVSKQADYPSTMLTPDINPQVFVEVRGLKEVARNLGYDELIVLAMSHGSLGYMMPRSDYLPVYEGFFGLLGAVAPILDKVMKENGGLHKIYQLTDNDKNLTLKGIINDILEFYAIYVKNYRPPSGPDVNVMDHPNAYEETVSMGPRTGDIVYNAMYGLATKGKYVQKISVPNDPNTDKEVLSLGKLE
jgi:hypothetical protein